MTSFIFDIDLEEGVTKCRQIETPAATGCHLVFGRTSHDGLSSGHRKWGKSSILYVEAA